jgi:hypothetical protein
VASERMVAARWAAGARVGPGGGGMALADMWGCSRNKKQKRPTYLVGIAFLLGLGSFQVGLDAEDYLLGLSDMVGAQDCPLARLNPVQRCTTPVTIRCFKKVPY